MPHLIWDPEFPPEEPPDDADPLVWRLAYGLRGDHCRADDGRCAACQEPAPCRLLTVALRGLVLAVARGDRYRQLLDPTPLPDEQSPGG